MELVVIEAVTSQIVNPHAESVKALVDATKAYKGDAEHVPAGRFVFKNDVVEKNIWYVQQAAKELGVSARIAVKQHDVTNSKGNAKRIPFADVDDKGVETGFTTVDFKIGQQRADTGKPKGPRTPKSEEASAE